MYRTSTTVAVAVAAAAAGVILAGCGTSADAAAAPSVTTAAATTTTAATTTAASAVGATTAASDATTGSPNSPAPAGSPGPCTAADITPSLGAAPAAGGQITVPFRYTNSGSASCTLVGYPGATLQGPDYPQYGPQYQLVRSTTADPSTITLAPGQAAVAQLTLGTVAVGDPSGWQPTELLTIAPGDTTVMTVPFPANTPISRQDAATHPATYVGVLTGPVS